VQGDGRSYNYLVGLSSKEQPSWPELETLARSIPKKFHKVNRVAFLFGDPVPGPVTDVTPTRVEPKTLDLLRQADSIVNEILLREDLTTSISQVPVILFPVAFGIPGQRAIGIRTIITKDFMTGVPALPGKEIATAVLDEMVSRILKEVPGISKVAYDLTSKPPGTTEWE
jgi:GMP synthase (glutamine-hydrolysing)